MARLRYGPPPGGFTPERILELSVPQPGERLTEQDWWDQLYLPAEVKAEMPRGWRIVSFYPGSGERWRRAIYLRYFESHVPARKCRKGHRKTWSRDGKRLVCPACLSAASARYRRRRSEHVTVPEAFRANV